jgi:hypothetical protein
MTIRKTTSRTASIRRLKPPALHVRKEFVEELRKDGVPESFIAQISEPTPADGRS